MIPNTIFETTKMVKATINHAVAGLCKSIQEKEQKSAAKTQVAESSFSATDYLFVSTRVAKAFPDSVESALILAYSTAVIAQEQSERWTSAEAKMSKQSRVWALPLAAVGLISTYFILMLGSQPLGFQEVIVYAVNPALFGAALRIGSVVSSQPYIAFPVGVAIICACALAGYYLKKAADKRALSLRMEGLTQKPPGGGLRRGARPGQVMPLTSNPTDETQPDMNGAAVNQTSSPGGRDRREYTPIGEAQQSTANAGDARSTYEQSPRIAEDETQLQFKQVNTTIQREGWMDHFSNSGSDFDDADVIFNVDDFSDVDEAIYELLGVPPRQSLAQLARAGVDLRGRNVEKQHGNDNARNALAVDACFTEDPSPFCAIQNETTHTEAENVGLHWEFSCDPSLKHVSGVSEADPEAQENITEVLEVPGLQNKLNDSEHDSSAGQHWEFSSESSLKRIAGIGNVDVEAQENLTDLLEVPSLQDCVNGTEHYRSAEGCKNDSVRGDRENRGVHDAPVGSCDDSIFEWNFSAEEEPASSRNDA